MQRRNEVIQKSHLLAVLSIPGLHPTLPQALALANGVDRGQRPSAENPFRLTTGNLGQSYLNGIYTGVGGWGEHRAQKCAEAEGEEMKNSEEQEWAVNPTNITAAPLYSPVWRRALMGAGGSTIRH